MPRAELIGGAAQTVALAPGNPLPYELTSENGMGRHPAALLDVPCGDVEQKMAQL